MAPARRLSGAGGPGFDVVERAADAIDRHKMLEGVAGNVVVAVSGGPDSTCLLDVFIRLGQSYGVTPVVAHVDHGLSEASSETAARVARAATESGLDVHVIKAPDLTGANFHARARDFRYAFFETVAENVSAARVATGHTLDDRVETTMARLIHGAGTEGLAGLPPADGTRIRPLIEVRRRETRSYCDERALSYVVDPANDDPRFERARVRKDVLAPLEAAWGEGAIRAIAHSAERLHEDAQFVTGLAATVARDIVSSTAAGVRIARDRFDLLPRALKRRVLESAVGRVRDRSGGIEAVLDALERETQAGARFAVAGGAEITVAPDHLLVTVAGDDAPPK